ncbi:3-oxoacyl-[acyl-carrier protein] reductase [Nonlabens tegetincola]|uniref:3-oxoacyl-[acyl-carrier protein] reductase n=1 Tax=Nonlabens tegetincola TaxID=323273 RepID=A0A090Q4D9_9FLAO|nr:SDR family oxidoreductase [Nonlabens tegetincola]GAK97870.1 3-oxoacyl-[acyl-carrier protein] reductase [Nonlabens tegetincola]
MKIDLKDKTALVCGSSTGIGESTARLMAAAGARVVLLARNPNKLQKVLSTLDTTHRDDHTYLVADFSNYKEVDEVVSAFAKANPIHILVNNTGGPAPGYLIDAEVKALEDGFTQHIKCNQVLVKACAPGMKEAGYGRIINIISTSVKAPIEFLGVSNVIRGAVANWAKTLSNELGPYGITVNNVLPGFTATERLDKIIAGKANRAGHSEEQAAEIMKNYVPARRFAQPEEVANAVLFLSSNLAGYINGINLPVDGGRTKSL